MDDLFRDADDESDTSGEKSSPSVVAILSAFREASGRPSSRDVDEGEAPAESTSRASSSPKDIVQETIAAFRKAERRSEKGDLGGTDGERRDSTEASRQADIEQSGTRAEETDDDFEAADESPREPSDDAPDEDTGAFDDLGPAFRKALSERGGTGTEDFKDIFGDRDEPGAPEATREHGSGRTPDEEPGRVENEESTSSDAEVDPVEQRGDTIPTSENVEVTAGGSSADAFESGNFPSRPSESFLWVSARPVDDPAVVSVDQLGEPRAKEAEAFLLEGQGDLPYKLLMHIRSHSAMSIYLKPVFWRHEEGQQSDVGPHVDGEWTQSVKSVFRSLQGQAASINQRVNNLVGNGGREEGGVELRVLRFMATRNHEFTPQRTVENSDGFVYPKLSPLLERESRSGGGELAQVLSVLEERRLLNGNFVLRQHACRNCGSAFLNFEEICPHCGASDLDADDLVHHFRCAFTGALSEYKKEQGKLVCPKCDRQLKQIGVDYDKPSVVYTCRRCHEQFQDPDVHTTCYQCEHTNPPEQQVERAVKEYEVTALGEETAVYGLSDSLLSILERESRVLDYATFQLIVESEAARIERYQRSTSSLLMVRIAGLNRLRMELGERSEEVVEEIATAFDNTLRSSDYLSARDESLYLFLLTETNQSGARRAGERLENNIEGVLDQNLKHPPELDVAVQPLRPGIDLDGLAEQFLGAQTRESAAARGA